MYVSIFFCDSKFKIQVYQAFLHEADLTVSDAIGKFLVQYDIMKYVREPMCL